MCLLVCVFAYGLLLFLSTLSEGRPCPSYRGWGDGMLPCGATCQPSIPDLYSYVDLLSPLFIPFIKKKKENNSICLTGLLRSLKDRANDCQAPGKRSLTVTSIV